MQESRKKLLQEIAIVLVITFGISGLRSALRLINSLAQPEPLNEQTATITDHQSTVMWIDLALQLCSAAVLFGWGFLALFLLGRRLNSDVERWPTNIAHGVGLAALIGVPGLALYVAAVHFGWSKQVVPSALDNVWWEAPILIIWSAANAFAEEIIVVLWFLSRLKQLNVSPLWALSLSALLRGSYHLYQGISAGFGNIIMGLIFGAYFYKTARIWPLIVAHFLIDIVAFVGYALLRGHLGFLGL